jgi:hypothetical protein
VFARAASVGSRCRVSARLGSLYFGSSPALCNERGLTAATVNRAALLRDSGSIAFAGES